MKTTLYLTLTLLTFTTLTSVPNSFAQDASPEYIVRTIYFLPKDGRPQPDIDAKLDRLIKGVQQLYADEMERHGFGRKTFVFEADSNGNAIIHHVKGNFTAEYYRRNISGKIGEEVSQLFDYSKNIYHVVVDLGYFFGPCGFGSPHPPSGGLAVVDNKCLRFDLSEFFPPVLSGHELGHAFGLPHDFRGDAVLMSYGPSAESGKLSRCTAEWLNAHRYFNTTKVILNQNTEVEMLPPLPSPPFGIRLRFEVTDPDGLSQIQLIEPEWIRFGTRYGGLYSCKSLNGVQDTIEFVSSELLHPTINDVVVNIMDVHGNYISHSFPINPTSIIKVLPPGEVVKVPDANLAAVVRQTLGLASNDPITERDMRLLRDFNVSKRQITDLSGLQHATDLRWLFLGGNQIHDITPLTGLTKLRELVLGFNQISDITLLPGLRVLETLSIGSNQISDITPLVGLPQLKILWLDDNQISDITPLAGLTALKTLGLGSNQISDITPLAALPQLANLILSANQISDITPLAGLTMLVQLELGANQINDITPLGGLTKVRFLRLGANQINDITPLGGLTTLERLHLDKNQIDDITFLAELVSLRELKLTSNHILNTSVLRGLLEKNPGLKLDIDVTESTAVVETGISGLLPIYYIGMKNGTLHHLINEKVEAFLPSLQDATSLAVDMAAKKLYWTERMSNSTGKIRRANLNGTNVELVKKLTSVPHGIAVDVFNSKLYLTNSWGKVQRLNLDGSNFKPNLITGLDAPSGLAMDVNGGKVYWIEQTGDATGKIQRANLDGSNVQLVKSLTSVPRDLTIDTVNGRLYLTNSWGKVQRLNFDGSNFEPNLITDLDVPEGITLDVVGGKLYWTDAGGINRANLNGENIQNVVKGLDVPGDIVLGIASSDTAIAAAPAIVAVAPDETLLHSNFPNPFNPETWIPYQLTKPTEVTITIYAVDGQVVRRLALGRINRLRYRTN